MCSGRMPSIPASEPRMTWPSCGLHPAAGAQAVAVERRADDAAVGEADGGRAVPRLHEAGVEGVEALELVGAGRRGRRRPPGSSSSPRAAASGRASISSSRTLSNVAESEPPSRTIGMTFWRSRPKSSEASCDSRARIQFLLPISVLISPLWAMTRNGWASSQLGNVFVEKRECTSAIAEAKRSSQQVGEEAAQLRRRSASPCRRRVRLENEARRSRGPVASSTMRRMT